MRYKNRDMKKAIFILSLVFTLGASAQNHEIKIDLLDILVLRTLDVSYENHLNDEAAVGLSVFINFEPKDKDFRYQEDFQLTPYFRQFFTTSKGFDFFGEVFGTLNFGEKEIDMEDKNYSDFALGIGAGGKHISRYGYVFEFNVGIGRNLFNADMSPEIVPRLGVSIGKQF